MPYVASVGTYLPCWGTPLQRVAGDDGFPSGILADTLGLTDLPVTCIENSFATAHDAVRNALFAVADAALDVALVVGADKLTDTESADMLCEWEAMARDIAWDNPLGLLAPARFGLPVRRYLHESPATEEHLAIVAVKKHRHGVNNPKARLRFEITMEQALNAPTVVTPFRLCECASQSDGAAATTLRATVAVEQDFLTGIEPMSYQDLWFAERVGGHELLEAEATGVGEALPVNTGGLKAKGHPLGATGMAQCVELFQQPRGEAVNQVDGARIALAHNIGGPTAVSAVTILEGSGGLN